MKNIFPILIYTLLPFFISCKSEDVSLIEECCKVSPIHENIGNAIVYLPNIFTPNGDGVNDFFYVQGDSIDMVLNLEIRDTKGDLVFNVKNVAANDPAMAWDGIVNGEYKKGLYNISVDVKSENGETDRFKGWVCNYPCTNFKADKTPDFAYCQYPSQWDCWKYFHGCLDEVIPTCAE